MAYNDAVDECTCGCHKHAENDDHAAPCCYACPWCYKNILPHKFTAHKHRCAMELDQYLHNLLVG